MYQLPFGIKWTHFGNKMNEYTQMSPILKVNSGRVFFTPQNQNFGWSVLSLRFWMDPSPIFPDLTLIKKCFKIIKRSVKKICGVIRGLWSTSWDKRKADNLKWSILKVKSVKNFFTYKNDFFVSMLCLVILPFEVYGFQERLYLLIFYLRATSICRDTSKSVLDWTL